MWGMSEGGEGTHGTPWASFTCQPGTKSGRCRRRREEEEKIKGGKIISAHGINDRFENEVVKREERKSRKGKQRRLHSVCSPQTWPRAGPGTSALYLFWLKLLHIIIPTNIYLYIFLDLFCAEGSCLGWPALRLDHLVVPQVSSEEPDRVQKLSTFWKTSPEIFLCSIIHSAGGRACRRQAWEWAVKPRRV